MATTYRLVRPTAQPCCNFASVHHIHTHTSRPENILCVCRLESHCAPSHRNYVSIQILLASMSCQDELCSFGPAVSFRKCEESYTVVRH